MNLNPRPALEALGIATMVQMIVCAAIFIGTSMILMGVWP